MGDESDKLRKMELFEAVPKIPMISHRTVGVFPKCFVKETLYAMIYLDYQLPFF